MYLGARITPIIVMAVVIIVVVGGVLVYNYMTSQKPQTLTTTVTETSTVTEYSTIYTTVTVPSGNAATVTTTSTKTVTTTVPVTIIETVTVTSLPSQPPKTTSPVPTEAKGENFTVGNVQVYTTTASPGLVDTGFASTKMLMLLRVPKDTSMEKIMDDLRQLITNGIQITSNTVNVNIQQTYDPVLVVLLPRGTPCTMYKVIVNDGNASDGRIALTIQKFSTSDYCIQVVPQDNLYIGIIALRGLQTGHYVVDVTMDYGTSKVQYTIDLTYG